MAYLRTLILGKYINMFSGATITMIIWNVSMVRIVSDVLKTQLFVYCYYHYYYYLLLLLLLLLFMLLISGMELFISCLYT
jgi:hypothetical protein